MHTTLPDPARITENEHKLVEVVDRFNRPLGEMPLDEIHRQMLPHRSVLVLVYDQDLKLYLQKRSPRKRLYPGRWDFSAGGHVLAGEASMDAAYRHLQHELRLRERLRLVHEIQANPDSGQEFVSVYSTGRCMQRPEPNPDEVESCYAYTQEEFICLIKSFSELLTPGLVALWERSLLFPDNNG